MREVQHLVPSEEREKAVRDVVRTLENSGQAFRTVTVPAAVPARPVRCGRVRVRIVTARGRVRCAGRCNAR